MIPAITRDVNYRSPEYFISPFTEVYYKMGYYVFTPYQFSSGIALSWKFYKNNGDIIYEGNSLHSNIKIFDSIEDILLWASEFKNLLKLDL